MQDARDQKAVSYTHLDVYKRQFLLKPVINRIADRTGKKRRTVAIFSLIVFYVLLVTLLIVLGTRLVVLLRDAFYALPSVYESVISPALVSLCLLYTSRCV